ncbi:hypothetical protein T484DRAFT_1920143 [Baffinella frigidus]|nr:hypothetical protein T484DRAFT_1920143 [Cryptophyta sp. CCMP2293]
MAMVLHACDISAQARPRSLAIGWAERVHMEFFAQGDREALLQLPISPLCDRTTTDVTSSQIGFIEFIVAPIWQAISVLIPDLSDEVTTNLQENLRFWKSDAAKKFFGKGVAGQSMVNLLHGSPTHGKEHERWKGSIAGSLLMKRQVTSRS